MRKLLTGMLIAICSLPLMAQPSAPAGKQSPVATQALPPDAASRERILKLFEMLNVKQTTRISMQAASEQARDSARQMYMQQTPNATPEQIKHFDESMDGIMKDVFSSMNLDAMFDLMVPVYQRHFTNADIDSILAFYSSATGQKFLHELPQIVQESVQAMGPMQQQMMQDMMRKTRDRVEKEMEQEKKDQEKQKPPQSSKN